MAKISEHDLEKVMDETDEFLLNFQKNLLDSQEPLGEEFSKILFDNLHELYVYTSTKE